MPLLYLPLLGRLGNILFQYCTAREWCERNRYELCLHPWVGEKIFNIPEAVRPDYTKADVVWPERMYQDQSSLTYTRKQAREWLQIKPEVLEQLQSIKPAEVLCDLRQGRDYLDAGLVCLSKMCYWDACTAFGYADDQIEWESDISPTRLSYFQGDVNACGFGTTWVSLPAFYRMMIAKVHFRANSTFSWWACVLSDSVVYSPVIKGMRGGIPNQYCTRWVRGNWPVMADAPTNSDLHLREQ